jgi:acyl dehydratase
MLALPSRPRNAAPGAIRRSGCAHSGTPALTLGEALDDRNHASSRSVSLCPALQLPSWLRADGRIGGMPTIAFEDLSPGTVIDLGEVKVDREEMLAFNRRFDPQPFHLDEEAAKRSVLGGLCASGWFTACLWMRAYVDAVLADSTSQGSPGGREMSWLAPVFPGDLLRMRLEVTDARLSRSRPGLGLLEIVGSAHRGEICVLRMEFTGMFSTRA